MRTQETRKNYWGLYTKFTSISGNFAQWNRRDSDNNLLPEVICFDTDTTEGIVPSISYFSDKPYPSIYIEFDKDDVRKTAYARSMDKRNYTVYPQSTIEREVDNLFNKLLTEEGWRDADS